MDLQFYLDKQKELDQYIIDKQGLHDLPYKTRLSNTILAMMVETGELANEIRCFKHWSQKPMSDRFTIEDELVDVLHFYLSIVNQLGLTAEDMHRAYMRKNEVNFQRQDNGY